MDFSNRGDQMQKPMATGSQPMNNMSSNSASHSSHSSHKGWSQNMVVKWFNVILTGAVVIVLVGLLVFISYDKNINPTIDNEGKYVQTSKLQAVFLNTGQVYFGNITAYTNNYVVLTNIFYLQSNSSNSSTSSSSSTPTNVTLEKLGCELHAPLDEMVINRSSVTFWENLSPSGQVAQAVAKWYKDNPDGLKCSDQSTAGTSGTTSTQNTAK